MESVSVTRAVAVLALVIEFMLIYVFKQVVHIGYGVKLLIHTRHIYPTLNV